MTQPTFARAFAPVILAFLVTSAIAVLGNEWLQSRNIDPTIVMVGNIILFAASVISFYFFLKSLRNNRAAVLLRYIYGGMMVRMFIVMITALVYIVVEGKGVNKGAVFVCMFLYFLYSFMEVYILLKLSNKQKNAASGSSD